jgi:hypothetical protein
MSVEERAEGAECSGTPKPFLNLAVSGTDILMAQTVGYYLKGERLRTERLVVPGCGVYEERKLET